MDLELSVNKVILVGEDERFGCHEIGIYVSLFFDILSCIGEECWFN